MFALIQSKNHASNKGKTVGRYQFDTHPTGIGLNDNLPDVQEKVSDKSFTFSYKCRSKTN